MASISTDSAQFWRGRRVWISGHTGFKGAWLWLWLRTLGANLSGYALAPPTTPSLWDLVSGGTAQRRDDVRDPARVRDALAGADPEIIFHLAAQSLVKESYRDPLGTYATNVLGTAAVLEGCRELKALRCTIIVTSDKVYENRGTGRPFEEGDRLGGSDPYSSSKACAELVTESFRESFFGGGPPLATVRAGNVIGGGDWSADRLIPDCVRALAAGKPASLRYPEAVRPWQHVLEPLCGYLMLAETLAAMPEHAPRAVNFGPDAASFCRVCDVVDAFSARFGGRPGWERDATAHAAESQALTLSSDLAERTLGWRPRLGIAEALAWTADWYRAHAAKEDMVKFSQAQIARYRASSGGP
jgi:CDP-glucose 4,6-dehydratase